MLPRRFGGAGRRFSNERADLRARLEVDDTSPLKNVAMRNKFEHFDERIDEWWANSSTRGYMDMVSGAGITARTQDRLDAFRTIDTTTLEITFWGEPFSLSEIVGEAQRLLAVLDARLRAEA